MSNSISDKILQDEVLVYISERHHTTVRYLLDHLSDLKLEENELQIIRDLIHTYR